MNVYDIDTDTVPTGCTPHTLTTSVVANDIAEAQSLFMLAHPGAKITRVEIHSTRVMAQFNPVIQVAKGISLVYDDEGKASFKLVAGAKRWIIPFKELAEYGLFHGIDILNSVERANKPMEPPKPMEQPKPRSRWGYRAWGHSSLGMSKCC